LNFVFIALVKPLLRINLPFIFVLLVAGVLAGTALFALDTWIAAHYSSLQQLQGLFFSPQCEQ
jgi:hypothetical protein